MIKLGIYIAFFFMLLMFYGLPIHIIRDLFMTSRDFLKRLSALLRYRRAIQEMNRYPDATAEELSQENTCIICREEMRPWDPNNNPGAVDRARPKKLPCGHTLHLGCLKSWLERQQVCPTCRTPVTSERARQAPGNRNVGLRIQIGGGPPAPAPAQPGANAAGGAPQEGAQGPRDGQQVQPQAQQPENRPRVFNLGPLRLGFGANGAQVRELARQFGMQQPAIANAAANQPAATGTPAVTTSTDNLHNAASYLQQAEQALQSEIQSLQYRQQELQTSQLLMAELQRLRQRHQQQDNSGQTGASLSMPAPQGAPQNPAMFPHVPFGQVPAMPGLQGVPNRIASPFLGRHGTSPYSTSIPAGSPDLPEGVVIPPGWSLMPLQRLDNAQIGRQPSPQPGPASAGLEHPASSEQEASAINVDARARTSRSAERSSDSVGSRLPVPSRRNVSVEPTPVVSPSPVAPNWGGSAQLFGGGGTRLDNGDAASQADSSTTRSQSNDRAASSARSGGDARSASQVRDSQADGSSADKGKSMAATVEEASSDEEEEE